MPIASIVPIVDQSGSMAEQGKLAAAQTDTCTFINIMQTTDKLAVVAFSDNASTIFPSGGTSLSSITGQSTLDAACQTVLALTPLNMTNITAAIARAHGLLASAGAPRGMVLLSDGIWNVGGNPTLNLPTDIPIYTIALGNTFDSTYLQSIATATRGRYNYTADAFKLAEIYADIVAETRLAAVVVNTDMQRNQFGFSMTPVLVSAATASAYHAISWLDQSIQFTPGTPSGKQLTARLIAPNGQPSGLTPTAQGAGFVVIKLPNPTPGQWQVEIWNSVPGGVRTTVGVFEPGSTISMGLDVDSMAVAAGGTLDFRAPVTDDGTPIHDLRVSATLERPVRPLTETLAMHKDALDQVEPPQHLLDDGVPEPLARLSALQAKTPGDQGDLHPRVIRPLAVPTLVGDVYTGRITDIPHEGEYTVRVTASGYSPVTKTEFHRQRRISFVASAQS